MLIEADVSRMALATPFLAAAVVVAASFVIAVRVAKVTEREVDELFRVIEKATNAKLTAPDSNRNSFVSVASWAVDAAGIVVTFGGFAAALILLVRDDPRNKVWIILATMLPLFVACGVVWLAAPKTYTRRVPSPFQWIVVLSNLLAAGAILLLA
jgi:hypothetical protein